MEPLKISARMANSIAVSDDWTPAIDALLQWLVLDRLNLNFPNPTPEQVKQVQSIVDRDMPLLRAEIQGQWYWAASSPCYSIKNEQTDRFRKRWNPGIDSPEPNWGKRKAKWSGSEGAEKNYDLPVYLRSTPEISWYVVGDKTRILEILQNCRSIGKKRSLGYGQVIDWDIEKCEVDCHLWNKNILMRPIPIELIDRNCKFIAIDWGWRPPTWLQKNKTKCAMPAFSVVR